jgi:hypothetical protein
MVKISVLILIPTGMLHISEKDVIARLRFDNRWWSGEGIEPAVQHFPRRVYFKRFYDLIEESGVQRAVVMMGPRRVGKTVLVFHAIQELLNRGVPGTDILYVSLETPLYNGLSLERLILQFRALHEHQRDSKLFIFFDEIQYLKGWEVHLKSLVDSYTSFKFVATGSAAAALKLKSIESGAGRFTDFILPPLTFYEYLYFVGKDRELIEVIETSDRNARGAPIFDYKTRNIDELNQHFVDYLNFGGYPEAVLSDKIRSDHYRYIKSDIIDKVLLRDLPSLYGINDIQELNKLFNVVAYNTGNELSIEKLAQSSGIAKNTIKRYLEYMEAAFLMNRVHRIDDSLRRLRRVTSFKVYLTNPSMRAALFGNVEADSDYMGQLTETAVFSQWIHSSYIGNLHYARWKNGEVDIVAVTRGKNTPSWAVEVKWSDNHVKNLDTLSALIAFAHRHRLPKVVATTRTVTKAIEFQGVQIEFKPSSLVTYALGRNILQQSVMDVAAFSM